MTDYTGSNTPADQRDLWRTPPALFAALDAEFCFQLDAAAAPHNALCRKFISEKKPDDGTSDVWGIGITGGTYFSVGVKPNGNYTVKQQN